MGLAGDKFKLTQVRGHSLRTKFIEGQVVCFPHKGLPFLITGPPLRGGMVRMVKTSPVVSVSYYGSNGSRYKFWIFRTVSGSIYKLERVHD